MRELSLDELESATGLRELTSEELELIAGGYDTRYNDGGDGWDVVGDGGDNDSGWDRGDYYGDGDYGGGDNNDDRGDSGGDSGPTSNYPAGFDHQLDESIDQLVKSVAQQILAKPDVTKIEYGAVVWKDASGNLHVTDIVTGAKTYADFTSVWGQIDFAAGGKVVAYVHSHPTLYNATSDANPTWLPVENSKYLSSPDFDELLDASSGAKGYGYDATNFRSYIVTVNETNEYYGFDQDPSYKGRGGQATWSVASQDY